MSLISKPESINCEKKVLGKHRSIMAARLLSHCLGIQAEPVFETADLDEESSHSSKVKPYSSSFLKDIIELGMRGEAQKFQLQVIDEIGSVMAESKGVFSIDEAINLLKKLPLPLSPQAPPWLKDCLRKTYR